MKFNKLSQELQELWTRGVDHSVFNEEWAKMGGACRAQHDSTVFLYSQRGFIELVERRDLEPFFWEMPIHGDIKKQAEDGGVRMATPSECAAAGIDYVPFMGWRDIESAPYDVEALLLKSNGSFTVSRFFKGYVGFSKWMPLPLV